MPVSLNRAALLVRARQCMKDLAYLQARTIAEDLIRADKRDVEALEILSRIAFNMNEHDQAIALIKKCIEYQPRRRQFLSTLGGYYAAMGRDADAERCYQRALKANPQDRDALAGLAGVYEKTGDIEAARKVLDSVAAQCEIDPVLGFAYATVALTDKRPLDAARILERNIASGPVPGTSLFLLGKARERLGEFDKAFEAYTLANQATQSPFDLQVHEQRIANLIQQFTPEVISRLPRPRSRPRPPSDSSRAVFIVGRPRSGTTLVSKIIGAHPLAVDVGEIPTMHQIVENLSFSIGSLLPYPQSISDLEQEDVDRLGAIYLDEIRRLGGKALRVVDKALPNYLHIGMIHALLPGARIIHVMRDPIDNCLACYTEDLRNMSAFASDLRLLGLTMRLHERLMRHWSQTLKIPILDVKYEDLVDNQESVSRRMIEHIGLPWDDACLRFYEAGQKIPAVAPTLSYDQVRKPIYRTSVGRAEKFRSHLGPLMDALEEGQRVYLDGNWPGEARHAQAAAARVM